MPDEERKVGPVYRVLAQDLYSTDFHSEEMGVRQAEVWRSRSRQFTKDAEIIGKIEERKMQTDSKKLAGSEKTGFIVLRKSLWTGEMNEGSRRLVVKLFSKSGGWLATLEEMVAESVALSYGINEPVLSFAVVVHDVELVTYIRQVWRTGFSTETYTFYILGPQGSFEVFRIEGKRASLGDDFKVLRLRSDETVAEIDGKFADIGGEFVVEIKDPVLAENEWFCRVLQCFSVAIRFRNESRKKIQMLMRKWKKGDLEPLQHRYETSLLANPRKLILSIEELEDV